MPACQRVKQRVSLFFFCHPAHYFTLALSFNRHYWVVSVLYRKKRKNHFLCSCENTRSTNAFLLCIKNMYLLISGVEPTFNSYNIYFSPLNIFLFNFTKSVLCRITCVLCSITIHFGIRFFSLNTKYLCVLCIFLRQSKTTLVISRDGTSVSKFMCSLANLMI